MLLPIKLIKEERMKKVLFIAVVLLLVVNAGVFADRNAIEGAIQSYEAVVVEAENTAQLPLISPENVTSIQDKAQAVAPAVQAISGEKEWKIDDAARLAALNVRFNQAMTSIAQKLIQY
jgi:hypothetical protein